MKALRTLAYSAAPCLLTVLLLAACADSRPRVAGTDGGPSITLRNNHESAYEGPLQFRTTLPDGTYEGGGGTAVVEAGEARVTARIPAASQVVLRRTDRTVDPDAEGGPFSLAADGGTLELRRGGEGVLARLAFDLVVRPGTTAGPADAVSAFEPLDIDWNRSGDGPLIGTALDSGYRIRMEIQPHGGGWADVRTVVTRQNGGAGDAYVALVRRVATPGIDRMRMRWNGREVEGPHSPEYWERDFWYTRGVDWTRWQSGGRALLAVNAFTPSHIVLEPDGDRKIIANHFYVWERARAADDGMYLISEIAGPNPDQVKSRYMPVRPYTPPTPADTLELAWRLAVTEEPAPGWEDSQLRVFAGYRDVSTQGDAAVVDLGAPYVEFGTSYFPYSTFNENFDYYRVPGLDKETWWPFSAEMWSQWRKFVPQMQTDLRIIKSMGFEWVRLHYVGHLNQMPRQEALAFLDFYMGEARDLGLKVLADSEGPAEWLALLAGRYSDVLTRVEMENETLIAGIQPGDAERWTEQYYAIKRAAPETQVFLTGAGANGMFEVLQDLGVPFDRVGLHAYKHGPEGKDAFSSHALGTGGYATSLGMQPTLGEFNWKSLTRLSPEDRQKEFRVVYEEMLEPRAIPEFMQFHFQETISVNPSISRSGVRHYETISLDRRPKPEAQELVQIIRRYARPDAPIRELRIEIPEVAFTEGRGRASYTITNHTDRPITVSLEAEAFEPVSAALSSDREVRLAPGQTVQGTVSLSLDEGARAGTYHHFLVAEYEGKLAYGWGVAANPGAPDFEPVPVLADFVTYPTGAGVVQEIDWTRPLAVAFGPDAHWLEMEMGYITANTLQAATGRPVRLSSTADVPASYLRGGTLILVGTPEANPLIDAAQVPDAGEHGVLLLQRARAGKPAALVLTGADRRAAQAAATDFILRYWQNAKDAAIRIAGMEPGAALGNKAGVTNPDPP